MSDASSLHSVCPHCGAVNKRRLGTCGVCHRAVCDDCGNVQFSDGQRRPSHIECLRKDGGGFKMIKFVR